MTPENHDVTCYFDETCVKSRYIPHTVTLKIIYTVYTGVMVDDTRPLSSVDPPPFQTE